MSMRPLTLCLLAALSASSSPVRAQPADGSDEAARLFNEGRLHYEISDFEAARVRFEAARSLRPLPELDYDIARCWDRLGHVDAAIAEYRKFLDAAPTAANAAAVRTRVAELERARDAASPARRSASARRLAAPIAVGGTALLGAVVGSALVGSVAPDYDRLRRQCQGACQPAQWAGLQARAYAGYALWGVAGALAIGDAVLWLVALRRGDRAARAWLTPGARGPLAGVRF
jgi:tetratricopeptide (TPR) repeat protein